MQAEILAINHCIKINLDNNTRGRSIVVCSDSQAALKALNNPCVKSKSTKECIKSLNKLGKHNKVTIAWVPGHQGIKGNELADKLAVSGTVRSIIDIQTLKAKEGIEEKLEIESIKAARHAFANATAMIHAKKYIRGFEDFKAQYLLNQGKRDVRVLTGLMTGHGLTYKYLGRCGKVDDETCRLCGEETETVEHWIEECVATNHKERLIKENKEIGKKDIHYYKNLLNYARHYRDIYNSFFREESDSDMI